MFYDLKRIREQYDLTQREIAKILKISKSSYNYFETGEHIIPLKHLNNFCNTFHVSMDYICKLSQTNITDNKKHRLIAKDVGKRLKTLRLKNKLTQKELAIILNTTQSNISSYENGNTLILTAFLYNYAKHFKVSMDYLVGRNDTMNVIKIEKIVK